MVGENEVEGDDVRGGGEEGDAIVLHEIYKKNERRRVDVGRQKFFYISSRPNNA